MIYLKTSQLFLIVSHENVFCHNFYSPLIAKTWIITSPWHESLKCIYYFSFHFLVVTISCYKTCSWTPLSPTEIFSFAIYFENVHKLLSWNATPITVWLGENLLHENCFIYFIIRNSDLACKSRPIIWKSLFWNVFKN